MDLMSESLEEIEDFFSLKLDILPLKEAEQTETFEVKFKHLYLGQEIQRKKKHSFVIYCSNAVR